MTYVIKYWKQIAFSIILAAVIWKVYSFGYKNAESQWQSKWDKNQLEIAQSNIEYSKKIEQLETVLQTEIDKVNKDAKDEIDKLQSDVVAANTASSILRDKADKYAAAARLCSKNTGSSDVRETASDPARVLAGLLSKSEQRATTLAEYADRARLAGAACEKSYQNIRSMINK